MDKQYIYDEVIKLQKCLSETRSMESLSRRLGSVHKVLCGLMTGVLLYYIMFG